MAVFCLLPKTVKEVKAAINDGRLNPEKLARMTSEERHVLLEKYVGKDNALQVNSLLESKILLKNQQRGFQTWIDTVSGLKPAIRRDLETKVKNLDRVLNPAEERAFLKDLATTRLGANVTVEEAKNIVELSKRVETAKANLNEDFTFKSRDARAEYGTALALMKDYVGNLKLQSEKLGAKYYATHPLSAAGTGFVKTAGIAKSFLSTLDNSFPGRQGIKVLLSVRYADIWAKNFLKTWHSIGKELAGQDAMLAVKANVFSRPNALNGKYVATKVAVGLATEEAFPESALTKTPLFGRVFKAAESAYNGAAMLMRADLADRMIASAEKAGKNMLDPKEAAGIGKLVNSLTGRASLGKLEPIGNEVNAVFFSGRFLKANFDVLTAHVFDKSMDGYAKREAAKNLLGIVSSSAGVLAVANALWPGSVEVDPRSSNFGKIKIGDTTFDVTGGAAALVTLASRITPNPQALAQGHLEFDSKNASGIVKPLNSGYGSQSPLDVLDSFWQGKLAPLPGFIRDLWKQQDYSGNKIDLNTQSLVNEAQNLLLPLPIQTAQNLLNDPHAAPFALAMLADGLGISTSTRSATSNASGNWDNSTSKTLIEFKSSVGGDKFKEANLKFNEQYNQWVHDNINSKQFTNLSDSNKQAAITKAKAIIETRVLKDYGFKYKPQKKSQGEKSQLKNLQP